MSMTKRIALLLTIATTLVLFLINPTATLLILAFIVVAVIVLACAGFSIMRRENRMARKA